MTDATELPQTPTLMIAGPGELHTEDLEVFGRQVTAHYGDVWTEQHNQTIEMLGKFLGAADPPYLIPGTGTTCLDAALFNLFEAGQKVVVANTGFFGMRLMQMAQAHRLSVIEVPVPPGEPADPSAIADAAKGADGILSVHVDTSTGVRHPIDEIASVAQDTGAIYMVDGIASVGGETCKVDEMGIDCVVTGTQKGFEAPPGLGILALGPRGRNRVMSRSERPDSWYLDLQTWDWYRKEWGAWHPHPVTMPTNLVLAVRSSMTRILETGLEAWIARRADLAKRCREGLRDLGLEPVPAAGAEANLVVAMYADEPEKIQKHLLEHGIMISGGLTPLQGRTIRVGLMGRTASEEMVDRVLGLVAEAI